MHEVRVQGKTLLLPAAAALTWGAVLWALLDPGPYRPEPIIPPFVSYAPGGGSCQQAGSKLDPKALAECDKLKVEYETARAELIQQARAANAAEAANRLALSQVRLTVLQTIVGLFTLLAAAAAAVFAGRAASEARRGSDASEQNVQTFERASKLQMIAYVGLKEYSLASKLKDGVTEYTTELLLSNFGQTPALSAVIRHTQLISDEDPDFTELDSKPFGEIGIISKDQPVIFKITNKMTVDELHDLQKPEFLLMFVAEIVYLDVYGDPQTYSFVLASQDGKRWNALSSEAYSGFNDEGSASRTY